ncbi:MAG: gamma-glutamylcyclotransferase [Deltaproteobacteria bacterium]|nr:gamma-glutamylcyclotransferase [Deltaproteobacteria bacterium]
MWIFAYGSLIFKPDFVYLERRVAVLDGYARRFWQGSPDHRGTPSAPGRVVTLVPMPGESCAGCVYRVADEGLDLLLAKLDHREQAGFDRVTLPVRSASDFSVIVDAIVYVARADNASFLGPASEQEIAAHIARSSGPSGPNVDYLLGLHRALIALGIADFHVQRIVESL